LTEAVAEFGWSLETVADEDGLQEINQRRQVVAVLFDPKGVEDTAREDRSLEASDHPEANDGAGSNDTAGWSGVMGAVRNAAPGACLIACQKFSDPIPWPELVSQGAFHSLSLPLDASELRRSLGFVWAARRRHSVIQLDQAVRDAERDGPQSTLDGLVADDPGASLTEWERDPMRQRGRASQSVA
jgi:hypothetical protein